LSLLQTFYNFIYLSCLDWFCQMSWSRLFIWPLSRLDTTTLEKIQILLEIK
jgi:hypothetical protein